MSIAPRLAVLAALVLAAPAPVSAAAPAAPTIKRTCDPSKVYHGPRGGKYTLTRDCKKVYQKRR